MMNNRKKSSEEANNPPPSLKIRAIYDDATIRVYQAYNDAIADAALAGQTFQAPLDAGLWSSTRMTWIKPSKVWMAYRCGFTLLKDKNQRRVLALDIARPEFEKFLERATVNHIDGNRNNNSNNDEKKKKCRNSNVVVQWDPERVMNTKAPGGKKQAYTHSLPLKRSIQIGLRGNVAKALLDPGVVLGITDVTEDFRAALKALQRNDIHAATTLLWPCSSSSNQTERLLEVSEQIRERLGMGQ
jgi:hypothetical protein